MQLLHSEIEIVTPTPSTLLWDSDELLDVTSGQRICLDGSVSSSTWNMTYPFDRAISFRQHDMLWSVAYDNRGTKGVLLKNGSLHRELNRSYYCAKAYDYPVAMTVAPTGRVVVIHCPTSFNTIEIDDAETGATLATKQSPDMEFHSRLAVSRDGRYLLDAGWFWHPLGGACVWDLAAMLEHPAQPGTEIAFSFGAEIDSAAFLNDESVVVTSTEEVVNEEIPTTAIGPLKVGVWSLANGGWRSTANLAQPSGMIMPWRQWIIAFRDYPKAIEIATGTVVYRWEHLYSGKQVGSIELGHPPPPPLAIDPHNGRFAVSGPSGITVVTLAVG